MRRSKSVKERKGKYGKSLRVENEEKRQRLMSWGFTFYAACGVMYYQEICVTYMTLRKNN